MLSLRLPFFFVEATKIPALVLRFFDSLETTLNNIANFTLRRATVMSVETGILEHFSGIDAVQYPDPNSANGAKLTTNHRIYRTDDFCLAGDSYLS